MGSRKRGLHFGIRKQLIAPSLLSELTALLGSDGLARTKRVINLFNRKKQNGACMTQDEIVARNVFKVRLFINAWEAIDPDVAMACLSDDIVYINQPLAPVLGQRDVRKIVEGIMKLSQRVHWELRN